MEILLYEKKLAIISLAFALIKTYIPYVILCSFKQKAFSGVMNYTRWFVLIKVNVKIGYTFFIRTSKF